MPITVTATAGGTGGNNSPRQIQTLTVDFGDGSVETRTNVTGSVGFTHTYFQQRGYTITATATDVAGNTGIASDSIIIGAAPLPTVTLTASDTTPDTNENVSFTITAAAGSGGAPLTSVRATHNGEVVYSGTTGGSFVRRFPQGTHVVVATATDANGNEGRTQVTIVAGPP